MEPIICCEKFELIRETDDDKKGQSLVCSGCSWVHDYRDLITAKDLLFDD